MKKVAVYAGTRNIYEQMYVCLKSLLANTIMDKVYLLIEDDEFPYKVPDIVKPINVSDQQFFLPGSPNYGSPWSYMTMMRCALTEILPEEHMVLWLDCDTIVMEDISDLFYLDMMGYHYAAAMEPQKSKGIFRYFNAGVLFCDLISLTDWGKEHEERLFLNSFQFQFPDQDVINLLCQGRIREISSEYNANPFTVPCIRPKIIHFAANKDFKEHWAWKRAEQIQLMEGDGE